MKKDKVCVIINPISGRDSKQSLPNTIAAAFDQHKYDIMFRITGYPEHATEITRDAVKSNCKWVITAGGDGTVNEVAKVLVGTKCTLGIIPLGSGNGLARDLHIPLNTTKALQIILSGNTRTIDYGVANGHIFFCTCGVGFDAFISDKFAEEKLRGPLGYVKQVLEGVIDFRSEEYEIEHDNGSLKERAFVVTCANASQYGNAAFIAPYADLEDGKMNISILKPLHAIEMPQTTLQLFTKNIDKNSKMISLLTQKLSIKRQHEGVMHVDGEPVRTGQQIDVEIIPRGLRVLAPSKIKDNKLRGESDNIFSTFTRWISPLEKGGD